jgi:hypothetical protein
MTKKGKKRKQQDDDDDVVEAKDPDPQADAPWEEGKSTSTLKAKLNRVWKKTPLALKVRKMLVERILQCSQVAHYASVVANAFALWLIETNTPENQRIQALPETEYHATWTKFYTECMKVVRGKVKSITSTELKEYLAEQPWDFRGFDFSEVMNQWCPIVARELGTNARVSLVNHYEKQEEKTLKRIPEFKDQWGAMLRLARNYPIGKCKHKVESKAAHAWVAQHRALWHYPTEDHRRGSWTHKYQMRPTLIGKYLLMKMREEHGIATMSLLPLRGYGLNHLQVDTQALANTMYQAHQALELKLEPDFGMTKYRHYSEKHPDELFAKVMDVTKMDVPDTLTPDGTPRWTFDHSFRTDGTAISLTFKRWYCKTIIPSPLTEAAQLEKERKQEEKRLARNLKAKLKRAEAKKNQQQPKRRKKSEESKAESSTSKGSKKRKRAQSPSAAAMDEEESHEVPPKKRAKKSRTAKPKAVPEPTVPEPLTPEQAEAKALEDAQKLAAQMLKAQMVVDPFDPSDHEDKFLPVFVEQYRQGLFKDERIVRSADPSALRLIGVDPGRNTLMEVVVQSEDGTQTFHHRLSKKQYYHESKMTDARLNRLMWLKEEKKVQEAVAALCQLSLKVADFTTLRAHAQQRLQQTDQVLWAFFGLPCFCQAKFRTFRMKKRTIERFFRRVLAPDAAQQGYEAQRRAHGKPGKRGQAGGHPPKKKTLARKQAQRSKRAQARSWAEARTVVAYGNGNFPVAARGQAAGPLKPQRAILARRVKVCLIDEFRTSKVHAECTHELEAKHMKGWKWRAPPKPDKMHPTQRKRWEKREASNTIIRTRKRFGKEQQLVESSRDPW